MQIMMNVVFPMEGVHTIVSTLLVASPVAVPQGPTLSSLMALDADVSMQRVGLRKYSQREPNINGN